MTSDPSHPVPSHLAEGPDGPRARMVDVGGKASTRRTAKARALLRFPSGVLTRLLAAGGPKGPVQEVARTAGILAAKRTGDLIPLCHPLALDFVDVSFRALDEERLEVAAEARTDGRTGVEMEALTAASVAALTVYDMAKALDKGIVIEELALVSKTGGKSGDWSR
ncbi:MAG: cyclic pyranopterin monophosphate synthase MoaC [Planctomycetota bacterium]